MICKKKNKQKIEYGNIACVKCKYCNMYEHDIPYCNHSACCEPGVEYFSSYTGKMEIMPGYNIHPFLSLNKHGNCKYFEEKIE